MERDLVDTYRAFDTSLVSDALDKHGIDGVINGLAPASPTLTAVGRVHTMRFERADEINQWTNFPYAMLNELVTDRVLVIDGIGPTISCWGGNASQLAANAGMNGVVINGGYRDVSDIRDRTFPVFGRAPTPKSGQQRITVTEIGEPLEIDGVTVQPDDILIADATGIVVVPADEAEAVVKTAEETLTEEVLVEEKISNGASVADLQDGNHKF